MTKFNPEGKKELTYGECLGPAMSITDKADAEQYLQAYIDFIQEHLDAGQPNPEGLTAESIAKSNLGYFAGYYDNETRAQVERLFMCAHPIFGSIAQKGAPTAEEAFNLGVETGKKLKKNR